MNDGSGILTNDDKGRKYCKHRNQVRKMTRKQKKDIEKDLAKQAKFNPNLFWRYIYSKIKRYISVGCAGKK